MGYLGNDLQVAYSTYKNIDDISGSFNGSTTSFSLLVGGVAPVPLPLNSQQCLISVGGVIQRPDDTGAEGFRLSSGNIVFSSAPSTGEDFFGVILAGADYVNVGANFPSGSAAVPSITFDSDLDTGIYNSAANQVSITTAGTERLRIDSAGQIEAVSLGTATAPSFSFTTDPNTGIYSPGADQVALTTAGTARLYVSSAGLVGIGDTLPGVRLSVLSGTDNSDIAVFSGGDRTRGLKISTGAAGGFNDALVRLNAQTSAGQLAFSVNSNEAVRIDNSSRLLVGTSSSPSASLGNISRIVVQGYIGSDTNGGVISLQKGETAPNITVDELIGVISFNDSQGYSFARIDAFADANAGTNDYPGRLMFSVTRDGASSPTEALRIENTGRSLFRAATAVTYIESATTAGTTDALITGAYSGGTTSLRVWTNGNVQNTNNSYTALSDIKLKENVVDAKSQWDDLKALRVRNYNLKEGQTHTQIGLVAQEVEPISPGLVYESPDRDVDGNDLGTVTKSVNYSVLYMKAVKALQEAMERIEQLETNNADLLARVTALESA